MPSHYRVISLRTDRILPRLGPYFFMYIRRYLYAKVTFSAKIARHCFCFWIMLTIICTVKPPIALMLVPAKHRAIQNRAICG